MILFLVLSSFRLKTQRLLVIGILNEINNIRFDISNSKGRETVIHRFGNFRCCLVISGDAW